MTKPITLSIAIVAAAAASYMGWATFKAKHFDMIDAANVFPYPDQYLISLERHFNQRHPPPLGSIKLHGEWGLVFITSAGLTFALAIISLGSLWFALRRGRKNVREDSQ